MPLAVTEALHLCCTHMAEQSRACHHVSYRPGYIQAAIPSRMWHLREDRQIRQVDLRNNCRHAKATAAAQSSTALGARE